MEKLTEIEKSALNEALDDEYHSWSTYDQVLTDFGDVRPFNNIRDAEARHIAALKSLYVRYGLTAPENSWLGNVDRYESVAQACEAAVEAEIANGAMYKSLLQAVAARRDITEVFLNLQEASQLRHLPAFERCVARGSDRDRERGPGMGRQRRHKARGPDY